MTPSTESLRVCRYFAWLQLIPRMATSLNTVLQLDPRLATLYEIAGSLKPISIDVVCLLSPRCALHTPLRYSKRG